MTNLDLLLTDLAPIPPLESCPQLSPEMSEYLLLLRRQLVAEKTELLPSGPSDDEARTFSILCHRFNAQIELIDLLLTDLRNSITNKGD